MCLIWFLGLNFCGMETNQNIKEQQPLWKIRIHYNEAVRCIDLENFLSSIRMIYQHTLAEETGLKTRAFTNVLQIKGIEKGSIIIDMFHNLQSIDFCGIIDNVLRAWELSHILQLIINSNNLPENKQMFIERFKSAIRNFIKVDFESTTETTTVRVNKNGEMEIKTKTKRITVNNN